MRLNPCAGGVGDQPAGLMEAFAMIDDIVAKRSTSPA
jgi:hypothetical protein